MKPRVGNLWSQYLDSGCWRPHFMIATVILSLATTGCRKVEPVPEVQVTVQATRPERGPISELIYGDAVLAPLAQAALSPKISAPIKNFYVERGAHVRVGQLLVTLEDRDLEATALDNRGGYKVAEAGFQQTTRAQVPEDTQRAELDLAQAKANLELNQSIVASRKELLHEGAIPGRDLDTAQAAFVQAQAAFDTATKRLQSMQNVSRTASLNAAQGQLSSAKGKYENAEAMLGYASLRSPIDGVVTDRTLFAGEIAPAGTPIVTVMALSSLLAKLHLSQAVTMRMKAGDRALVTVPGVEGPVEASVSLISPALDPGSTTVEVWVHLENPSGKFKPGTPVHVAITGDTVPNALQVPAAALITGRDGALAVMVVDSDGTTHQKPVKVGIRGPETVQIISGIGPQDIVITSGAYGVDDGTKVKIGNAGTDANTPGATGGGNY